MTWVKMIVLLSVIFAVCLFIWQARILPVDAMVRELFLTGKQTEFVSDSVYGGFSAKEKYREEGDVVELKLRRIFALYFGNKGYVWYNYTCVLTHSNGEHASGSWNIPYKIQIEKHKDQWYIVRSWEGP